MNKNIVEVLRRVMVNGICLMGQKMNTKPKHNIVTSQSPWVLAILLLLLSGCSTGATTGVPAKLPSETPAQLSMHWQTVGVYNVDHSIMTAGFLDEQHVVTGGVMGQMAYSSDGAQTWLKTDALADCRYGMEIVSSQVIWTCGGATHVRKSVDGGRTWLALAAFGDPHSIRGPCHSMSFLDENTGWLATSELFGATTDGGVSWTRRSLPETANKIATVDTYLPGEGYLLDQSGALFFTKDDGRHWREASRLPLGELEMPFSAYQLAAMRFADAEHGLIAVSSSPYGKPTPVMAFRTSNGGESWVSDIVPVVAGPVYLSRDGIYLTVISAVYELTLLKYDG